MPSSTEPVPFSPVAPRASPMLGRQRAIVTAARVARDPAEDRQAVEAAELLLAPQARVEHLERERAAGPEDQPGEDAGDQAQLLLRRGRSLGDRRRGLDAQRRIWLGAQGLKPGELGGERVRADAGR